MSGVDAIEGRGTADFVTDHQQREAVGALMRGDKGQTFRSHVPGLRIAAVVGQLGVNRKIPIVDIVIECGTVGVGHIVDQPTSSVSIRPRLMAS
jgi:hypothetical protein